MKTKPRRSAWYEEYKLLVRTLVARKKLNNMEISDLEHNVLLAELGRRDPAPIANREAYLSTAVRNAIRALHKVAARDVTHNHASLDREDDHSWHFGTESDLDTLSVESDFEKAFAQVPQECREAFRLRRKGLTYKEISVELEIPLWRVKRRISEALRTLQEELSDYGHPRKLKRVTLTIAVLALALPSFIRKVFRAL